MHRSRRPPFALILLALLYLLPRAELPGTDPFLWEAEKDGRISHLMGTVHSSHPLVRELPPSVLNAVANADVFLPELELSPQNIGAMLAAAFDWEDSRLRERLPDDLYRRLRRTTQKLGLPDLVLEKVSFEMLPFLLGHPPGEDFTEVMDVKLYQTARENGLRIVALETLEEQLAVFRGVDESTTLQLIEDALDEAENHYPSYRKLIEHYAAGDADAMHRLVLELKKDAPEAFREALFTERNLTMTKRALPHLEAGGAFVAVGLGHYFGDKGILALLEERGYTIERVGTEPATP